MVVRRHLLVVLVALNIFVWGGLFAFESMIANESLSYTTDIAHSGSLPTNSH